MMTTDADSLGGNLRLQVAVQLLAATYPRLTDAEQTFTASRMKTALAHADELIALEMASRRPVESATSDQGFVSDGNEG